MGEWRGGQPSLSLPCGICEDVSLVHDSNREDGTVISSLTFIWKKKWPPRILDENKLFVRTCG